MWMTKSNRTINSPEIDVIYNKERNTKIYLFIRKNKDDRISNEFYFLGEMSSVGEPHQTTMRTGQSVVEVEYSLEIPVREDLYDYIVGVE